MYGVFGMRYGVGIGRRTGEDAAIVSHARKEVDIQHECCQNGIDCEGQPTPVADEECGDRYAAGDGEHSQRGDGAAGQEERYQAQEQQP